MSVWKKFFQRQGPVIASTLIALMALWFTIYNAYLDQNFKEASIKPSLQAETEPGDFSFAAWHAQRVIYVIRRDEMIRREDAIRRAELAFGARHADPKI